jgi:hypothetical protein
MSLEFNKKSDKATEKPKLSKFGKIIIVALAALSVFLLILFLSFRNTSNQTASLENDFNLVISNSITSIEQSLIASGVNSLVMSEFEALKSDIINENDLIKKYDKTLQLITFALSHTAHNQNAVDELNGTRNRLNFAKRELNL